MGRGTSKAGGGASGGGKASGNTAQKAPATKKLGTAKQQKAVTNFVNQNKKNINSSKGQQIASNQFSFMQMTNQLALKILNSLGIGKFEIVKKSETKNVMGMKVQYNYEYLRKVSD